MKIPRIISSLDYISDKKIAEAAPIDQIDKSRKKRLAKPLIYSIGGTCAAAAVMGFVTLRGGHSGNGAALSANTSNTSSAILHTSETNSDTFNPSRYFQIDYNNLPFKYVKDNSIEQFDAALRIDGNGCERITAYNSGELYGNNPWREEIEIKELPVFFGKTTAPQEVVITKEEELPKDSSIRSDSDLPSKIQAYYYLYHEYSDKMLFNDVFVDSYCDYTLSGKPVSHVKYHKNSSNLFEAILYYNFTSIEFIPQDNEVLVRQYNQLDDLTAVGFYPIITTQEAAEKLLSGEYYTTVGADYISDDVTEEKVQFIELVYRTNSDGYSMPYYRWLVKLDDAVVDDEFLKKGPNTYGAYYVPAISPEYLLTDDDRSSSPSAVEEWLKQPHSSPLENFGVLVDRTGDYRFIPADYGTKVMAIDDGEVFFTGYDSRDHRGYTVVVKHSGGIFTLYQHLDKELAEVKVGDTVKAGQCIGYVGSSGATPDSGLGFRCTDVQPSFWATAGGRIPVDT